MPFPDPGGRAFLESARILSILLVRPSQALKKPANSPSSLPSWILRCAQVLCAHSAWPPSNTLLTGQWNDPWVTPPTYRPMAWPPSNTTHTQTDGTQVCNSLPKLQAHEKLHRASSAQSVAGLEVSPLVSMILKCVFLPCLSHSTIIVYLWAFLGIRLTAWLGGRTFPWEKGSEGLEGSRELLG